jgi:hypothetical protein
MSQVGHADSKMTLDVYAQLEKRAERSRGTACDDLLRRAKRRLDDPECDPLGHERRMMRIRASDRDVSQRKRPAVRAFRSGETETRTRDTTIFSRVLYQLSYLAVGA